eukprot:1160042-Pelagomonas_calceolata.AAC.7
MIPQEHLRMQAHSRLAIRGGDYPKPVRPCTPDLHPDTSIPLHLAQVLRLMSGLPTAILPSARPPRSPTPLILHTAPAPTAPAAAAAATAMEQAKGTALVSQMGASPQAGTPTSRIMAAAAAAATAAAAGGERRHARAQLPLGPWSSPSLRRSRRASAMCMDRVWCTETVSALMWAYEGW